MSDTAWQGLRYLLIGGGLFISGWSGAQMTMADITRFADLAVTTGPAVVSLATAAWGFYVKWKTRAVPEKTAARADVPTVSAATGAIEPASK